MVGNVRNMGLTSLDDLFKSEQERQQDTHERILNIPVGEIYPYARQPYSIKRPTPDLVRLMDSIEQVGVAEPLIVRPRTEGGYEIISGHRRDYCARTVGLESLPVIIREYTDDEADILVVDYNITREDLLPSEKARAYSLKLEAMKRQAGRPSKNSLQVGENFRGKYSVQILSEQVGENVTSIQRYIRLTKLIPPLLEQVDNGVLNTYHPELVTGELMIPVSYQQGQNGSYTLYLGNGSFRHTSEQYKGYPFPHNRLCQLRRKSTKWRRAAELSKQAAGPRQTKGHQGCTKIKGPEGRTAEIQHTGSGPPDRIQPAKISRWGGAICRPSEW